MKKIIVIVTSLTLIILLGVLIVFNNKLYLKMHNDLIYTKIENEHIINNLYKDEVSVLKIKKSLF